MTVLLSPYGGVGAQFLDNSGNVLTGGKIFTYAAGTTTNQATYTNATGAIPHANPIILDAAGRVPGGEIWLTDGLSYKFVLKDSNDVLLATYDNVVGINSNFVNYAVQEEIQTATAGQTVFNLNTINYTPGTNSLSVFVDGVNQYDGISYAYVETDSDTVTFTSGLHVGALVKFTTAVTLSSGVTTADLVSYSPPFINSVPTTVEDKLAQYVSVKDFGAAGDADPITGVGTDDTVAIQAALDSAGGTDVQLSVFFPDGTYRTTATLNIPEGVQIFGNGAWKSKIHSVASGVAAQFVSGGTYDFPPIVSNLAIYSAGTACLDTGGVSGAEIYNNWFSGAGGVLVSGTADIQINNNVFDGTVNGIQFTASTLCNNISIQNNSFTGNAYAITLKNTRDTRICGNDFRGDSSFNIHILSPSSSNTCINVLIENNNFYTAPATGATGATIMKLTGTLNGFVIDGNTFDGAKGNAILADSGSLIGFVISNNNIKNIDDDVFSFTLTNATIAVKDNVFESGIAKKAIVFNTPSGTAEIKDNFVYSANTSLQSALNGAAMDINQATLAVISDNTVTSTNATYGILVRSGVTKLVCNDNHVSGATTGNYGLFVGVDKISAHQTPFSNVVSYASSIPTTGTWLQGDIVYNTAPASAGYIGWVCTVAGTPGTWKTFGLIS